MRQTALLEELLANEATGSKVHTILKPGAVVTNTHWQSSRKIHIIRIGGAGMSAVAKLALEAGLEVSGSESQDGQFLAQLSELGAEITVGFDANNLSSDTDLVVVSTAVRADNPEVLKARELKIPIIHRSAALAGLIEPRQVMAIAGTHGKTTTTSMAALALKTAGANPAWAVGAAVEQLGANASLGQKSPQSKIAVIEADESDGSLLAFSPKVVVITNFEADHLDFHQSEANLEALFKVFIARLRLEPDSLLVACADDEGAMKLAKYAKDQGINTQTYGQSDADWKIIADESSSQGAKVLVQKPSGKVFTLQLQIPGRHNALNALAALIASRHFGYKIKNLLPAFADFKGANRRFELAGEIGEITVIDDYAHHPKEVRAALLAAREKAQDKEVVAVFQPHLYSRTKAFLTEFAAALSLADQVLLLPIYAAREDHDESISSQDLLVQIRKHNKRAEIIPFAQAEKEIAKRLPPKSLVMMMGAGDIVQISPRLLESLEELVDESD